MSTKATMGSRAVSKALAKSDKAAKEARMAADASRLARDAVNAAVAAACAAERASIAADGGKAADSTSVSKVVRDVRAAAEEAVERAKDAIKAEDERDAIGAICAANLSARAAQRAGSLASAASVLSGKDREMALGRESGEPSITVGERVESLQERMRRELTDAIYQSAHYLVTYDSRILATFAREEDAFLLEGELADMDRRNGAEAGKCEVLDRMTGYRLGGYLITGGKMLVFVRDDEYEARYGKSHR